MRWLFLRGTPRRAYPTDDGTGRIGRLRARADARWRHAASWALIGLMAMAVVVVLLASDARPRVLLVNTLRLAGATCALALPVGVVLAWLLVRTDLPGRRTGLAILAVMLFVPLYLQAAAWQAGFGLQGWSTLAVGVPPLLEGWRAVIWVHTLAALPWVVLIVGVGLWLVEPELEEQALLEAPPGRVLLHVTLPSATAAIGVAAVWVLIAAAGEMTVTDLFVVRTYAEELYTRQAMGQTPAEAIQGMAPALGLSVGLVLAGLLFCVNLVPGERPLSLARRHVFRLGPWRTPLTVLVGLAMLLLVGVPLGNLAYKAGVIVTQTEAGRLRAWSPIKCLEMIGTSPMRHARELGWSVVLGVLAATTALAAAVLLGWWARRGGPRAVAVLTVSAFFLALPGPLIGLAIIWLVNRPEVPGLGWLYSHSILAPWLALSIRSLPLATLVVWQALRTLPPEMLDAAAVDGAGPGTRLWRIALPNRVPSLIVAWLVGLAVALGDLAASILVVPPGVTTLSIRIFGLLHYGVEDRVAGICLALAAMFGGLVALMYWVGYRWAKPGIGGPPVAPGG